MQKVVRVKRKKRRKKEEERRKLGEGRRKREQ
jgi:hypothetical protein